jgi:hypothetical protein
MTRLWKRLAWISLAMAVVCVTGAGIAFALIPDANGLIHGCYGKSNGQLRVEESATNCKNNEIPLQWGVQGSAGAPGPSDAFVATNGTPSNLGGGVRASIVSLSLRAGRYVVNAAVDLDGDGRCHIESSTGVHLSEYAELSTPSVLGANTIRATIPILAAFTLTSADTVSVSCQNFDAPGTRDLFIVNGTMTAVRVGTLTVQP